MVILVSCPYANRKNADNSLTYYSLVKGWPSAFGLTVNLANPTSSDTLKFGAANGKYLLQSHRLQLMLIVRFYVREALPWFMAAIGALMTDVLQHELFGR